MKDKDESLDTSFPPDAGDTMGQAAVAGLPTRTVVWRGFREALGAFLDLAKVIGPVYLAVAVLNYSGIVTHIAYWLQPAMRIFGLPGEAAVPLFTGWFLTLYSALGAVEALGLPPPAITAIGFMLLFCHALPLEWAILRKMGAPATRISLARFIISLLAGLIFAFFHRGEALVPQVPTMAASVQEGPFIVFLLNALLGSAKLLGIVLAVIVPVTIISELLRAGDIMSKGAQRLSARLGRFGPSEGVLAPLLIGLIFGILYGGGALMALSRTGAVKPAEARTVGAFLGLCHSVFEDPILFVAIGGHWFWLILVRMLLAILLTPILRRWM